ncbi:uncharacterized protein LOC130646051 [Hydractinia symbiolongicarpus]|uniref:uncharacterized protein LOC130646051 n=1 Tax=Hydractinia symbiolongicarpus TaxID=13093 RepID=UPI00254D0C27|nr:uncharacterized protein LOC130646051 [Hydractinia symbiolongicarpus]
MPYGVTYIYHLAKHKPASMSSEYGSTWTAGRAVDGNIYTLSRSKREANPWWQVDLGKDSIVYKVDVRSQSINSIGAKYALITVQDSHNVAEICGYTGDFRIQVEVFCQPPLLGRYVKLQLHRTSDIIFREVLVWGRKNTITP